MAQSPVRNNGGFNIPVIKKQKKNSKKIIKKIFSNVIKFFKCIGPPSKKVRKDSEESYVTKTQGVLENASLFEGESSSTLSLESSCCNFKTSNLEIAKKYAEDILVKVTQNRSSIPEDMSCASNSNHHKTVSWEIPLDKVKLNEFVGKGTYGTVHKCEYYGEAALKKIHVTNPSKEDMESFRNEISVLQHLRHEYILLFIGCIVNPYLAIVTEWCDGSSLYKELHINEKFFKPLSVLYIARQFAEGMAYLFAKSIIHCDLKSNNVFMTNMGAIKIGDFGLATLKTMIGDFKKAKLVGSVYWMAPEIIRRCKNSELSHASDVYAFGIVLYELITGHLPHSELDHPHQILYKVGSCKDPLNLNTMRTDLPRALCELVHSCCHYDCHQRPMFDVILKDILIMIDSLPKITRSLSDSILFMQK